MTTANAPTQGREQLLLETGDRPHPAAQRDLAGHGDVATHRNAGHHRDDRGGHGDAGGGPVLRGRAFRHVHATEFESYVKLNKRVPPEAVGIVQQIEDYAKLADTVASHLALKFPTGRRSWRPRRSPSGWRRCSACGLAGVLCPGARFFY
jgi:hypothetical protein